MSRDFFSASKLLAEEQDLAILVTQEQLGQRRVDVRKKEQVGVVEHGRNGGRGKEGGQDGTRTTPSRAQLGPLFPAPMDFGPLGGFPAAAAHRRFRTVFLLNRRRHMFLEG